MIFPNQFHYSWIIAYIGFNVLQKSSLCFQENNLKNTYLDKKKLLNLWYYIYIYKIFGDLR